MFLLLSQKKPKQLLLRDSLLPLMFGQLEMRHISMFLKMAKKVR